jgi:hypothetical protein
MASIQITHRGSYEHYKTRTKVFINWLTEAAHKCCKLDDVVLALKGRAGKNARKNGEEVLLTTREITILCQKIAEKKSFKIPDWILALLRTIIAKRTEYAAFYSELSAAGGSAFDRSNAGHTHFIDVLQQAYDIFAAVDHSKIAIHVHPRAKHLPIRSRIWMSKPLRKASSTNRNWSNVPPMYRESISQSKWTTGRKTLSNWCVSSQT